MLIYFIFYSITLKCIRVLLDSIYHQRVPRVPPYPLIAIYGAPRYPSVDSNNIHSLEVSYLALTYPKFTRISSNQVNRM
nr:MAG TPA: hypothetical protein [Caudoviricetes sp.]